jgi:hypothetical protein
MAIHFRGEAHSFVCFAGTTVEESGAEKCSEKALALAADDVFGSYWWYAFNTNVCFRGYEVLIKMTDEMPLLLASRDKFVTLNIFD